MELNKDLTGKYINIVKNEGPMVDYKHDIVGQLLKKFFCIKRKEDIVLGKVLAQFGYKKNDIVSLTDVLYKDNSVIIGYMVNGKDNGNKIILEFDNLIFQYNMIISDKDKDITCKITVFNKKNIEFKISKVVEKLDNGKIYLREYSPYSAKYKVIVDNREIGLYLGIKKYDEFYERNMLLLDTENKIENYLKNIDLFKGLEDIYKDIISYIGTSVKCAEIKLNIKSLDDKLKPVVTDMISIKNGICEEFMITRDNRCISIDKEGNCISKYNADNSTVVTRINEDGVSYTINASNEILLKEKAFIYGVNEYENAINEINDTKKRVLELVPKKR